MTPDKHKRLQELFFTTHDLPHDERDRFIKESCGEDEALARELRNLLLHADKNPDFLEQPVIDAALQSRVVDEILRHDDALLSSVGPYRLLSVIGEGGFARVYLAEQLTPLRRRVAVKVLRYGMDSAKVLKRFEAERQALAHLSHPSVVSIIDAGQLDDGTRRPYFVMEHVPGEPITTYCGRLGLSIDERIKLLIRVFDAVQHAHVNGVIHRDLKPSNILVADLDGVPTPKIIDFGVAKAIGQTKLTDQSLHTQQGELLGTLAYMSPEQLRGEADTRSDVYALGVLAYQLLAGELPIDVRRLGIGEAVRAIEGVAPTSLRLRNPACDGDLDIIVSTALAKDAGRRYQSAGAVADDLRRLLNHEPILARKPSAVYLLRQFCRRRRALVSVTAGAVVVFFILSAVAWYGLFQARASERRSSEFASFLARETLPRLDEIAGTDAVRDDIAQRCYDESWHLLQRRPDDPHLLDVLASALRYKSSTEFRAGRVTASLDLRRQAVEARRHAATLAPSDATTLGRLSIDLVLLGDALCALERRAEGWRLYEEAASLHERLVESSRSVKHLEWLAWSHERLTIVAFQRSDVSSMTEHSDACLHLSQELFELEPENPLSMHALRAAHVACARAADARGDTELARNHLQQALPLARAVVVADPARPPFVLDCVSLLWLLGNREDDPSLAMKRFEEARVLLESLMRLGMRDAIIGSFRAGVLTRLAGVALDAGNVADANRLADEALALREFFDGPLQRAVDMHWQVGRVLARLDRRAESEEHLSVAFELQERAAFAPGADVRHLWDLLIMMSSPDSGCYFDPVRSAQLANLARNRTPDLNKEQERILEQVDQVQGIDP